MLDNSKRVLLAAIFLLWIVPHVTGAENYASKYKQLNDRHADGEIEPLLNEWRAQQPHDPDAWITSANYYFNRALSPTISTETPEGRDLVVTDTKTGKVAGSISLEPDAATLRKAAGILREATGKFPNRLDIWCGLAYLHQERGDFESEFDTLRAMVAYVSRHREDLRWVKGEPLPAAPEPFIADKLHTYGLYYHKKRTPPDSARFLKLAKYTAEQFPKQVVAFNDIAAFYVTSGQTKEGLKWLRKARAVDPHDPIVLMNLGDTYAKLGDYVGAAKAYRDVIDLDRSGEYAQAAQDALAKIKTK